MISLLYFYEPVTYLSIIKLEKINCVKLRGGVKRCLNIKISSEKMKLLSLKDAKKLETNRTKMQ